MALCVLCHLSSQGKTRILPGPLAPENNNLMWDKLSQYPQLTYHLAQPEHHHPLIRPQGLDAEEETDWECEDEGDIGEGSEKVGQEPE